MRIDLPCAIEQAVVTVTHGSHDAFQAALSRGFEVLSRAEGFLWAHALHRIEDPDTYLLLVGWRSVEDHTERFAESELSGQWRAEIGPYLAGRPEVAHHTVAVSRAAG